MNGKFITFEGPDGAGKTSVMNRVIEVFNQEIGDQLLVTREPGGNKISEEIRKVILDRENTEMDYRTEALLMRPLVASIWLKPFTRTQAEQIGSV